MKISDAIMLGSTMIKPVAGKHLNMDETEGCAWGMVQVGGGMAVFEKLIWLATHTDVSLPCGCTGDVISNGMTIRPSTSLTKLGSIIIHLFNDHVMTRKDWTLERLVDWVRSVEPDDPEENKNVETKVAGATEYVGVSAD